MVTTDVAITHYGVLELLRLNAELKYIYFE